jgi:transcriptional regulator GlxA family with amidase domain
MEGIVLECAFASEPADLERIVLALASNADEYWTTQEIADFVGRSRRHVYRILARARHTSAGE